MGAVRVSGAAAGYCTDVANDMETQTAEAETDKSEIEAKLAQTGPSRSQGAYEEHEGVAVRAAASSYSRDCSREHVSHYATFGGGAPIATKLFLGTVCVLGEGNEAGCFEGTVDALKCCGTNAMERFDAGACRAGKFVERGNAGGFEGAAGWRG